MTRSPGQLPAEPAGARRASTLASRFAIVWRQFWQGYWRSPIGC